MGFGDFGGHFADILQDCLIGCGDKAVQVFIIHHIGFDGVLLKMAVAVVQGLRSYE